MKQQFSLAYVRLVVATVGFTINVQETDYDGVDLEIVAPGDQGWAWSPRFDLQVKCTSQAGVVGPETVAWRMEAGPFRKLINPRRVVPAYLAVMVVPEDPKSWLEREDDWLGINADMYWARAANLGDIADGAATKTVHIPTGNLFDVSQLRSIMEAVGRDGGVM
jgi:hypothetical protein